MGPGLERHRAILDFTLASLARRKGRNLSLLLVYATVVFALASVLLFTHALRVQATATLQGAPELTVQKLAAGRHDLAPEAWIGVIEGIRGVAGARGRLWGYYFDPASHANFTVMVPDRFWGAEGEAVLGPGVARTRLVGAGQRLHLRGADGALLDLRVREVTPPSTELVASDLVLVGEADFRRLFGTPPGVYTDVVARVANPREVNTIAAKVTKRLPDARAITRAEVLRSYESIFDWRSGLMVALLSASVLAFAIVAWDKASGLSAEERREIGVLKAIGWETSDVLLVKLWEGAAVSLVAFLVGVLAAYGHVFLGGARLLRPVLEGWSGLYPELELVPFVSGLQLATLFFLTVVPYTVATLVPSWRAATVDPDEVMRNG
jgi:ABC-type lipoprotein release transport system permease subunit